jgi:uncharacterized protein
MVPPALQVFPLDGSLAGLVERKSVFWAIVRDGLALAEQLRSQVMPLYEQRYRQCFSELCELRFTVRPTTVYVNITERCNLDCTYCYLPRQLRREGRHLSGGELESILAALDEYFAERSWRDNGKPLLVFHGSEPLLRRDLILRVQEKYQRSFRFGIQTNGLLLDRDLVGVLRKFGVTVGISLDAASAHLHDQQRKTWSNTGTFSKVMAALEMLRDYEKLNVICTITTLNVNGLGELVRLLHSLGISSVMLNPVRLTQPAARELKPDVQTLLGEFVRALEVAEQLYLKSGRKIEVVNFANTIAAIVAPGSRRLMCDISPCGAGRCFFAVSAKGEVFPCSEFIGLSEYRSGSLLSQQVGDCLADPAMERVRQRRVESIAACCDCEFMNICGAPCPAEIVSLSGSMFAPSPYCVFFKGLIRYAFASVAQGRWRHFISDGELETLELVYGQEH